MASPFFMEFVRVAQANPTGGFVDYYPAKTGNVRAYPEGFLCQAVARVGWVLGTGQYADDAWAFFTELLILVLKILLPLLTVLILASG